MDGFLIYLDINSKQIVHSTLMGGNDDDMITDVAATTEFVGSTPINKVYVVGNTNTTTVASSFSSPLTTPPASGAFPLANPSSVYFQSVHVSSLGNESECFVALFKNHAINWSSFYGGSSDEYSRSIAINEKDKKVYITGITWTSSTAAESQLANSSGTFPLYSGGKFIQLTNKGGSDAFFAGFTPAGQLDWSTFYGSGGEEIDPGVIAYPYRGGVVRCDKFGNIVFGGTTRRTSSSNALQVQNVSGSGVYFQPDNASINESLNGTDAFLCLFKQDHTLRWATHFGGSGMNPTIDPGNASLAADEWLRGLAVTNFDDGTTTKNKIYLHLTTASTQTPVPSCPSGAYCNEQTFGSQDFDAFITCLDYEALATPLGVQGDQPGSRNYFGIQTYPNPAREILQVRFIAQRDQMLELYLTDVLGKEVTHCRIKATAGMNTVPLNVQQLQAGMYYLRIGNQTTTDYAKVVKY